MEEEHAVPVRPGDDPRPRVAKSDSTVASRCHKVSVCRQVGRSIYGRNTAIHHFNTDLLEMEGNLDKVGEVGLGHVNNI